MREVTQVARDADANGATAANLVDASLAGGGAAVIANQAPLNTLVNSNRIFINALAAITSLDC